MWEHVLKGEATSTLPCMDCGNSKPFTLGCAQGEHRYVHLGTQWPGQVWVSLVKVLQLETGGRDTVDIPFVYFLRKVVLSSCGSYYTGPFYRGENRVLEKTSVCLNTDSQ